MSIQIYKGWQSHWAGQHSTFHNLIFVPLTYEVHPPKFDWLVGGGTPTEPDRHFHHYIHCILFRHTIFSWRKSRRAYMAIFKG